MPIHIKGSGGADKSKGLTATAQDIISGKTALVNGQVIKGAATQYFYAYPMKETTEGSSAASQEMVFECTPFNKNIYSLQFRRESWDPDADDYEFDARVVKSNTVHSFMSYGVFFSLDSSGPGTGSGSFPVIAEVFTSTSSDKLTIRSFEIEFEFLTSEQLKLTLPSGYYFEGEWLNVFGEMS